MKTCLLFLALLLAAPAFAQAPQATEAPSMLADVQDEVSRAKLKPLNKYNVTLKPETGGKQPVYLTLQGENLSIRVSVAEFAKARSRSAKVQQKYDRAVQFLRDALKANRRTIELNQPQTRDLEHLLASWALPKGKVAAITWQEQPLTTYRGESWGGGHNQTLYPEGQVFYFYPAERNAGFYAYINIPKPKGK